MYQLEHYADSIRYHLADQPLIVGGVLGTIILAIVLAAFSAHRLRLAASLALFPSAALWILLNRDVEGATLIALSYSHGITTSDLIALVAAGVGGLNSFSSLKNNIKM